MTGLLDNVVMNIDRLRVPFVADTNPMVVEGHPRLEFDPGHVAGDAVGFRRNRTGGLPGPGVA